jgi:hypothetical protein
VSPDKGWKKAERRMAKDMGCTRIPVTGERHGADFEDGIAAYQVKVRRAIPGWLWDWLSGIRGNAEPRGKIGVLVLKKPRQRDEEGLVVLTWAAWVDLHGTPKPVVTSIEEAVRL